MFSTAQAKVPSHAVAAWRPMTLEISHRPHQLKSRAFKGQSEARFDPKSGSPTADPDGEAILSTQLHFQASVCHLRAQN